MLRTRTLLLKPRPILLQPMLLPEWPQTHCLWPAMSWWMLLIVLLWQLALCSTPPRLPSLYQSVWLKVSFPRSRQNTKISGIADLSHSSPLQTLVSLLSNKFSVTDVVVHCRYTLFLSISSGHTYRYLTSHLPFQTWQNRHATGSGCLRWNAASRLAYRTTGLSLCVRNNLGGCLNLLNSPLLPLIMSLVMSYSWEVEECPRVFFLERFVDHHHDENGRYPLPKKPHIKELGESRSQAVR